MSNGIRQFYELVNHTARLAGRWRIDLILAFLASAGVFTYVSLVPAFADPDAFYHARLAALTAEQGIIRQFPWAYWTTLRDAFVDHHFLYHLWLIPWVKLLPSLWGLKLATVFTAAAAATAFYGLLKRLRAPWPALFLAVLLTTEPWLFRMSLAKANSFSLLLLLIGLHLLLSRRWLPLMVLSFLYVWSYGGWPLLLVIAACWAAGHSLARWFDHKSPLLRSASGRSYEGQADMFSDDGTLLPHPPSVRGEQLPPNIFKGALGDWKLVAVIAVGLSAGLVFNPYFPANLQFYRQQIVEIGLVNYQEQIGVGGEWYPYAFERLVADAGPVLFLLGIGLLLHLAEFERRRGPAHALMLLAFGTLLATLRAKRHVEYLVPFALLASGISIGAYWQQCRAAWLERFQQLGQFWQRYWRMAARVGAVLLAALILLIGWPEVQRTRAEIAAGLPLAKYEKVSAWLAANTPAGSIVLHSDWDDLPPLFYQNPANYYIVGLDPTFMYLYDQGRYWQWANFTLGKQALTAAQVRERFQADYVLVERDHTAMEGLVRADPGFRQVYQDGEVTVYSVDNDINL